MKIFHVAAEVAPFAKTGGLADVASAVPRSLAKSGHDVRLLLPFYKRIRTSNAKVTPVEGLQEIPLQCGDRKLWVSILASPLPQSSMNAWFVRCPELYERDGIYTQDGDEHLRFAVLTHAAILACQHTRWAPDVFHVHDWHTSLLPLYLRTTYAWDKLFANTRTVLTLHNNAYQGNFPTSVLRDLGLANETKYLWKEDLDAGRISFLKSGIVYATALSTVSRTYAREIQGDELGMGLQEMLRKRDDHLFGIVNGVDRSEWDPRTDAKIPHHFSANDLSGKKKMKAALLERVGLPAAPRAPVLGVVSRFTGQKGFELLDESIVVALQREDLRLVALGSGEQRYEKLFEWLAQTFPTKVAYKKGYDDELAHWIEAGSDMFLMPSRFEPCGLNQMYSLAYGTVPIVRKTGGLADTVEPWNGAKGEGTGFVFENFDAHAFFGALDAALKTFRDEKAWRKLQANGMAQDFSWERQIQKYVELYRRLPSL